MCLQNWAEEWLANPRYNPATQSPENETVGASPLHLQNVIIRYLGSVPVTATVPTKDNCRYLRALDFLAKGLLLWWIDPSYTSKSKDNQGMGSPAWPNPTAYEFKGSRPMSAFEDPNP